MMRKNFSWVHPSLYKASSKNGFGTFARSDIKKGSILIIFGGYVNTFEEEGRLPEELQDIAIQIEKNFVIGPITPEQTQNGDYVNHSCSPNSGIRGQITLYSMRDIKAGEEILFDYGTVLYADNDEDHYKMECKCGSSMCRGVITAEDWKNVDIQRKYSGYFPYYIQEKIELKNQ